jgi:predicted acyl esterase
LWHLWQERLGHARPWCLEWYDAKNEIARWAERAIPVERITAATFTVCGWQDFYVQGTLDYFQRIPAAKQLLMGPWKHAFPNLAPVEPIDLLELMVRWWDRWLKGKDDGIEAGPPITLFVQGDGVWRQEEAWPPRRNESQELYLHPDRTLRDRPPGQTGESEPYAYDPTVGLDSLAFDPWTTAVTDPGAHNGDDARSLCFTSEPLPEAWEVTGQAQVLLSTRASVTGLNYVAKLCDVGQEGHSRLVTMGWSPAHAADAGALQAVAIPLRATSHVFRRGHRLRLSLALADFPRLWPTSRAGEIRLAYDPAHPPRLLLPRTPPHLSSSPPQFPPLGVPPKAAAEVESTQAWQVGRELVERSAFLESRGQSRYQLREGGTVTYAHAYDARVLQSDPAGAVIQVRSDVETSRGDGIVVVKTTSSFTPLAVSIRAEIAKDDVTIYCKEWHQERSDHARP